MSVLYFDYVTKINTARCKEWHGSEWPEVDPWNLADWSNAMLGEAGEAANIVKKLRRAETGLNSKTQRSNSDLIAKLGEELADTFFYLDLLATRAGIYLPRTLVTKFNAVSNREGFPHRLYL